MKHIIYAAVGDALGLQLRYLDKKKNAEHFQNVMKLTSYTVRPGNKKLIRGFYGANTQIIIAAVNWLFEDDGSSFLSYLVEEHKSDNRREHQNTIQRMIDQYREESAQLRYDVSNSTCTLSAALVCGILSNDNHTSLATDCSTQLLGGTDAVSVAKGLAFIANRIKRTGDFIQDDVKELMSKYVVQFNPAPLTEEDGVYDQRNSGGQSLCLVALRGIVTLLLSKTDMETKIRMAYGWGGDVDFVLSSFMFLKSFYSDDSWVDELPWFVENTLENFSENKDFSLNRIEVANKKIEIVLESL